MKRFFAVLLLLTLVWGMIPVSAAGDECYIMVGDIKLSGVCYLPNGATEAIAGAPARDATGYISFNGRNIVKMNDFTFNGFTTEQSYGDTSVSAAVHIVSDSDVYIALIGESEITAADSLAGLVSDAAALYCNQSVVFENGGSITLISEIGLLVCSETTESKVTVNSGNVYADEPYCGILAINNSDSGSARIVTYNGYIYSSNIVLGAKSTSLVQYFGIIEVYGCIAFESERYTGLVKGGRIYVTTDSCPAVTANGEGCFEIDGGMVCVEPASENDEGEYPIFDCEVAFDDDIAVESDGRSMTAIERASVILGGVRIFDGEYLASGASKTVTEKPESNYAYFKDGVLTLNGYEYEGDGIEYIYGVGTEYYEPYNSDYAILISYSPIVLELIGENSLVAEDSYTNCIHVYGGLAVEGDGGLYLYSESARAIDIDDLGYGSTIFYMQSGGKVTVDAKYSLKIDNKSLDSIALFALDGGEFSAIDCTFGITVRADVAAALINGGKVEVSSGQHGIEVDGGEYAEITIDGGEALFTGWDEAMRCYNFDKPGEVIFGGGRTVLTKKASLDEDYTLIEGNITMRNQVKILSGSLEGEEVVIGIGEAVLSLGDVNADGKIDQYDYILVKRHYFETRILAEEEEARADVNADGKVDQYDYILIARHYFGTFVIG